MTEEGPRLRYARPPITEAVLQLNFREAWDRHAIERAASALPAEFKRQDEMSFEFLINPGGVLETKQSLAGIRLSSPAGDRTIILQPKVLIYQMVAPYPGWESFFDGGWQFFHRMREKMGFRSVERAACRFVNRIDVLTVAGTSTKFADYINLSVVGPAILGQVQPSAFLLQADFLPAENWAHAIIRVGTQDPALIHHMSLLLDIDVFCRANLPQSEAELRGLFERLRELKNDIFKNCITPEAERLFGGRV